MHARRRRGSAEPRHSHTYLVAAYAVTSIVTATTVNSGFVHVINGFLAKSIDPPHRCMKEPLSRLRAAAVIGFYP